MPDLFAFAVAQQDTDADILRSLIDEAVQAKDLVALELAEHVTQFSTDQAARDLAAVLLRWLGQERRLRRALKVEVGG